MKIIFAISLAAFLTACTNTAVPRSDLLKMPFIQNKVMHENYQSLAKCVKEFEIAQTKTCEYCDFSQGLNGSTLEPRNLTIFNELNYAEVSIGFDNYIWILMKFSKLDNATTSLNMFATKDPKVQHAADKYVEIIDGCGSEEAGGGVHAITVTYLVGIQRSYSPLAIQYLRT